LKLTKPATRFLISAHAPHAQRRRKLIVRQYIGFASGFTIDRESMRKAFGSAPSDGIFASFRSPWLKMLNTHGDSAHVEGRELAQFYFSHCFYLHDLSVAASCDANLDWTGHKRCATTSSIFSVDVLAT
jgi:hypothetical protein